MRLFETMKLKHRVNMYQLANFRRVFDDQIDRLNFKYSWGPDASRMWRGYVAPHNRRRKPLRRGMGV